MNWTTLPTDNDRLLAACVDRPSSSAVKAIHAVHASMAVEAFIFLLLGIRGLNRRFPQVNSVLLLKAFAPQPFDR